MKKNILKISIILLFICLSNTILSSNNSDNNLSSFYIEFIGQGGFISINYDKQILNKNIALRGGLGIVGYMDKEYTLPISISYIIGNKHSLETGIGVTPWILIKDFTISLNPNIWLGYRYQQKDKLFFKIGSVYYLGNRSESFFPGISIGVSF